MRRIHIKTIIGSALLMVSLAGCKKILEEQPRATYTPDFFQTERGVQGGITSLYAHLRSIYGQGYYYNTCETGTDEATYAQSADENFKVMDISGQGNITSSNSRADVIFGSSYSDINTASGVIENGGKLGTISNALLAEAHFFRGFDYFLLVQTFGGVALDLGSGELKFNTSPSRTSVRNTVPEVYTKAVFPDLVTAVNDLPNTPRVTGGVTKTVARLYLAKAYLTYAWWLENPNNIPTYPAVANRTDPAGHNAQYYYQQAYDLATAGIMNAGTTYGLQPTYYDVNLGPNDRNNEIMLYAEHTESSSLYTGGNINDGNGPNGLNQDNYAVWMMTPNYTNIRSSATPGPTFTAVSSVQREAEQHLGRPYNRMCPTIGVIKNTFSDKTNDSRYDGTFTTVYRGNWPKAFNPNSSAPGTYYNANFLPVTPGSAILTFLNDEPATPIAYPSGGGNSNVGAGVLPGRADWVISPNGISRLIYPGLWKMGPYRTDNGAGLGYPNAGLTRPFNIAKFSELFFVAAEAAVKGATTKPVTGTYGNDGTARGLINIIRARAGKWRFDNNGNVPKVQDNSAAMVAATPATIDIDYILAERSREYYGEGYRWYDLIRTQRWTALASTYQICGTAAGDHNTQTITRNIQPFHYLRPIPQGQLDAMQASAADKMNYQNTGYQ